MFLFPFPPEKMFLNLRQRRFAWLEVEETTNVKRGEKKNSRNKIQMLFGWNNSIRLFTAVSFTSSQIEFLGPKGAKLIKIERNWCCREQRRGSRRGEFFKFDAELSLSFAARVIFTWMHRKFVLSRSHFIKRRAQSVQRRVLLPKCARENKPLNQILMTG